MDKVIVIGNADFASIMYQYLIRDHRYTPVAFAADRDYIKAKSLFDLPVVEIDSLCTHTSFPNHKLLIALGYSNVLRNREEVFRRLKRSQYEILRYVHPDAKVYSSELGEGALIMPNAVIDVNAAIGDNSVVWTNCTVAHGAKVAENCWLASGCVLSGNCHIGANTFVGINASVTNHVHVGMYNIIGAHALVTKPTADYDVTLCGQHGKFRLNSMQFSQYARL
jgi:sugar O-acyltransferase (sialic acid O-acetyltransferase NeuD family)